MKRFASIRSNAIARNNRANTFRNSGDIERAVADYDEAVRLDPNYAVAYMNRGSAQYEAKNYDRALADFEAALQIDAALAEAIKGRELAKIALAAQKPASRPKR